MDDKEYEIQSAALYQVFGEATSAKIACYGATSAFRTEAAV